MCLQCLTNAKMIKPDIIPGYFLMVARENADGWKKDQFGLVRENDPDFVWDNPGPEPTHGMTDNQINDCPADIWEKEVEWMKKVEQIEKVFISDPMTSYEFVKACIAAGYNPEPDGDGRNVAMWFIHHCAINVT